MDSPVAAGPHQVRAAEIVRVRHPDNVDEVRPGQGKRFSKEIAQGVKRATSVLKQLVLEGLRQELDKMASRVRQVMKQTRARIFRGNTRSEGKLLSLFEPSTEVIRKGKAGKPNEFGPSLCVGSIEPAPSERTHCSSTASVVLMDNAEHRRRVSD